VVVVVVTVVPGVRLMCVRFPPRRRVLREGRAARVVRGEARVAVVRGA
jgi:hypothetical protein